MLRQPWFNFGLWIGDNATATDDNVVFIPEAVFKSIPRAWWRKWDKQVTDELPLKQRKFAWLLLGHTGPPPRMRLVIHFAALKEIVGEVLQRPEFWDIKRPYP